MPVQRITIDSFNYTEGILIDVRSPAEYEHAHIPGAYNLPLFSNDERRIVGTAYKKQGREDAIKLGLDFFGPRMRSMVEQIEQLIIHSREKSSVKPTIYIYCWRGGMRSAAVAWLLDMYGFRVQVLIGGYKSFRTQTLDSFRQPYSLNVLGGFTGSGKTELINQLKCQGLPAIDLEALAAHKGSAFGNYKMPPQPGQEMFENLLGAALLEIINKNGNTSIWVEDESQRIGDLNIPIDFWKNMRSAHVFFLEIPFEKRLAHIVTGYGDAPREKIISGIERISKRLGPQHAKQAIQLVEEGNIGEAFVILLQYYDKRYLKGLHSREEGSDQSVTIECADVCLENADLLMKHQ